MGFTTPLMLLGLLSAAIPVIIHLINRRKAKRIVFPALAFLLRSKQELARRLKIKQFLLLAARIGIFIFLPLAMAQPFIDCGNQAQNASGRLPVSVVLVIDDSASMSYQHGSDELFEEAISEAEKLLRNLRPWDEVALVWAHDPPTTAIGTFTDDRSAIRQAFRAHESSDYASDLPAALAVARDIQSTSQLPARRTLVFTDNTHAAWNDLTTHPESLRGLGEVDIHAVGPQERTNVAITAINATPSTDGSTGSYWISVDLAYFGDDSFEIPVSLLINRESIATSLVAVSPQETVLQTGFTHVFEEQNTSSFEIEAVLEEPEGITADNSMHMILQLDRSLRVLLINGDARGVTYNDELFYLEHALQASMEGSRTIESTVVTANAFAGSSLNEFDAVVMANVATLPRSEVQRLHDFVSSGGGLFITSGENIDPDRWNTLFRDLLPKPIRSITLLTERDDPDASIKATHLGTVDTMHPIFRVFNLPGGESLQSISAFSYVLLEPNAEDDARVLANYGDGGPALLERTIGQGRVLFWTTSIDFDWSDFPIRTAYLPFIHRVLSYLGRRGANAAGQVTVGSRTVLNAEALEPERLIVLDPEGIRHVLEDEFGVAGFVPTMVGIHKVFVTIGNADIEVPELAFSAKIPVIESDPTLAEEAESERFLANCRAEAVNVTENAQQNSIWPVFLFLSLLLFYAESLLSIRRRLWISLKQRIRGKKRSFKMTNR